MRWLRFAIGLLIALTLHSLLDSFYPNALAFFNPYIILVVYYAMGGNLIGAIFAGIAAGLVQDAYSLSIFGLHAFSLTVIAYVIGFKGGRPTPRDNARPAPPPAPRLPEHMVSCAECGMHLPASDALPGRGGQFCGAAHRAAHEHRLEAAEAARGRRDDAAT